MNLKPTRGRIILSIVLFIVLLFISQIISAKLFYVFDAPQNFGFPFTFKRSGGGMTPNGYVGMSEFYVSGLIGNLIFWLAASYLLSAAILRPKKMR